MSSLRGLKHFGQVSHGRRCLTGEKPPAPMLTDTATSVTATASDASDRSGPCVAGIACADIGEVDVRPVNVEHVAADEWGL